ncbi:MAG: hypothetical protein GX589_07715, partial [Deltaproteobacteria bacterium]|nr:hypothetical protein [Deltaproteobacteria bacterium]
FCSFATEKLLHPAANGVNIAIALHRLSKLVKRENGRWVSWSEELLKLMNACTQVLVSERGELNGQGVGNFMYGLNPYDKRVVSRGLLEALSDKVAKCPSLNPQAIGNALYGLQSLDSSIVPRKLLEALSDKVVQCQEAFKPQEIGNALYGLQSLDSSTVPRKLLEALSDKVAKCPSLNPQAIGNALYGLQSLDSSIVPKKLLEVLADKIVQCPTLDSQAIGNALYGLQSLDSSIVPKKLLEALSDKVVQCPTLDPQAIGNALYGLAAQGDQAEELLNQLFAAADKLKEMTQLDLHLLSQGFALHDRVPGLRLAALFAEADRLPNPNHLTCEHRTAAALRAKLPDAQILVGTYHYGFELDLEVKIGDRTINIEIDGPSHHTAVKQLRDRRRDDCLRRRLGPSFEVVRIMHQDGQAAIERTALAALGVFPN